jgi:hypothetical protein
MSAGRKKMEAMEARIETYQKPVKTEIKTGLVEVEATDLKANPEEKKGGSGAAGSL